MLVRIAIASSCINSDRSFNQCFFKLLFSVALLSIRLEEFTHQQLPTPRRSELPLPPTGYQVLR
jgi:hypothetical protein